MINPYKRAAEVLEKIYEQYDFSKIASNKQVESDYALFRSQFAPEVLRNYRGRDVLTRVFSLESAGDNKDSLFHALTIDKDRYRKFGSAQSQGVNNYPIYLTKKYGWSQKGGKRITEEEAIQEGEKYLVKLANGLDCVKTMPFESVSDYVSFFKKLETFIGSDARNLWIHKYLHMLYPELFSEFHSEEFKKLVLCALQIDPLDTSYEMAGQLAEIRKYMSHKDSFKIANVIYDGFPDIGKDGFICRLTVDDNNIKNIMALRTDKPFEIVPEWFKNQLKFDAFKKTAKNNNRGLFVVTSENGNVLGMINEVTADYRAKLNLPYGCKGIWHPFFENGNIIPNNYDGRGDNYKFTSISNLKYIFRLRYPYFNNNSDFEEAIQSAKDKYADGNTEYIKAKKAFDELFRPINTINETKLDSVIYGNPNSFFSFLYDYLDPFDKVVADDANDLGSVAYLNGDLYYDRNKYSKVEDIDDISDLINKIYMGLIIGHLNNDIKKITALDLSTNLKLKVLSAYFPNDYFGIESEKHLNLILQKLNLRFDESLSVFEKQRILSSWKNNNFADIPNYIFLRALYDYAGLQFEGLKQNDYLKLFINHTNITKQAKPADIIAPDDETVINSSVQDYLDNREFSESKDIAFPDSFEYSLMPENKPSVKQTKELKHIPRSRDKKINALVKADFSCEFNRAHESFISKSTGMPYMETHHLVPMEYWDSFDVNLDMEENIVCLCSNCHNEIHYGENPERLIKKLYIERKDMLQAVGINVTLEQLMKMYHSN